MREYNCVISEDKVRWLSSEIYQVNACGRIVTYACSPTECIKESDDRRYAQ